MVKRKKCLNCTHATVIRYGRAFRKFPMGVYCECEPISADADPRNYIHDCHWLCTRWQSKQNAAHQARAVASRHECGGSQIGAAQ